MPRSGGARARAFATTFHCPGERPRRNCSLQPVGTRAVSRPRRTSRISSCAFARSRPSSTTGSVSGRRAAMRSKTPKNVRCSTPGRASACPADAGHGCRSRTGTCSCFPSSNSRTCRATTARCGSRCGDSHGGASRKGPPAGGTTLSMDLLPGTTIRRGRRGCRRWPMVVTAPFAHSPAMTGTAGSCNSLPRRRLAVGSSATTSAGARSPSSAPTSP